MVFCIEIKEIGRNKATKDKDNWESNTVRDNNLECTG